MMRFCTYFDRNYLARAMAMHASLRRHAGPFVLHVLCLDEFTHQFLSAGRFEGIVPLSLETLLAADPQLAAVRRDRDLIDFYFTCTPSLLGHLLEGVAPGEVVTYLDADLFFYSDPAPALEELGDGCALIVPHRFPQEHRHLEKYGVYNVGWVSLRNDASGRECVAWWRERCLEWCHSRLEDGRYGDQKYLDVWPERFDKVVVSRHPGLCAAPWNARRHRFRSTPAGVSVDGKPMIFYHFEGIRRHRPWFFETNLAKHRARLSGALLREVYAPYVREWNRQLAATGVPGRTSPRNRAHRAGLLDLIGHEECLLLLRDRPLRCTLRTLGAAADVLGVLAGRLRRRWTGDPAGS